MLIDGKNFSQAMDDYNLALKQTPSEDTGAIARLTAGRALAFEGFSEWDKALDDYNTSLDLAIDAGYQPDPYILNSKGNVLNSLKRWDEARDSYILSAEGFRKSRGFYDANGGSRTR